MRHDTVIDPKWEIDKPSSKIDEEHAVAVEIGQTQQIECDQEQEEEDPFAAQEPRRPSKLKAYMGSLLSGSILSRAEVKKLYPYMLFIAFLTLLYISNVFKMQQLHRQHERLTKEVKELRAQSMTIASIRMNATRQSQIIKEIEVRGLNLKESLTPSKVIDK